MWQLTERARKNTHRPCYLPFYNLNNGNVYELQHYMLDFNQLCTLMRSVRFCIQSDPRFLLQKYLMRAKEIGQPEKLVLIKFLLGIDIPG